MSSTLPTASRFNNFRQRKSAIIQSCSENNQQIKLALTLQDQKSTYEPSSTFNNTKTSMRILKIKVDKGFEEQKKNIKSAGLVQLTQNSSKKLQVFQNMEDMKLVLNDQVQIHKKDIFNKNQIKPSQKRITISRQVTYQKQNNQKQSPQSKALNQFKQKQDQCILVKQKQQKVINQQEKEPNTINQQQLQESKAQLKNQNDYVVCSQGCGRKFARKALQKHIKACKMVFMSKRKQFNSQAKRLLSKQQQLISKQNKQKIRNQIVKTNFKGFQKTNSNWKNASQDFRSAIKAIKLQQNDQEKIHSQNQQQTQQIYETNQNDGCPSTLNLVSCQYCQKLFAKILLGNHLQNCGKKGQKIKDKKTNKKK